MHSGYGTASLPEIIWTVGAVAGFVMTHYTHRTARRSYRALRDVDISGSTLRGAEGVLFGEITRGFIFAVMAVIGLGAMLAPSRTIDGEPAPAAWFAMVGFLLIQGALVSWTFSDITMIKDMLRMVRKERELIMESITDDADPDTEYSHTDSFKEKLRLALEGDEDDK